MQARHRRSAGKTLRSGRVKNDRQSLGGFLQRYCENSHAVVEATRNWTVMYDWLDDICDDVVLAHRLKVKAIADAKIKTDKIDATVLAHLLRADLVPAAWAPTDKARELRVALRERMFYVRLRTMTKNRIVTVFDRYPEQKANSKSSETFSARPAVSSLRRSTSRRSIVSRSTGAGLCRRH
jgi:transposase